MCSQSEVLESLNTLLSAEKFGTDNDISYPGIGNENLRHPIEGIINRGISDFILATANNGNDEDFRKIIQRTLDAFQPFHLDSEDRERVCLYFEQMMDIVGLESSNGIISRWMYGFDI